MPSRIVREGLLDSQRYWSVGTEARQLFVHLLLLADDFGCVSLAPVFVRRRCFYDGPRDEVVNKLLEQLHDADLLRIYDVDGRRLGFIPRYRQRLQRMTLKHPPPPPEMLEGDDDAKQKFAKFQADNLKSNRSPTVEQPLTNRSPSTEVEVEGEVEGKRKEAEPEGEARRGNAAGEAEAEAKQCNGKVNGAQHETLETWAAKSGILREHYGSEETFRRAASAAFANALGRRATA